MLLGLFTKCLVSVQYISVLNNAARNYNKSYYRIPSATDCRNSYSAELAEKRQLWLIALRRDDLNESKLKYARVCSDHFISGVRFLFILNFLHVLRFVILGKPSKVGTDPDYVPSLKLGYIRKQGSICTENRRKRYQSKMVHTALIINRKCEL